MPETLLDEIADQVVAALETRCPPADPHTRFYEDLGFDSLMVMELVHRLHERRPALGALSLPDLADGMAQIGSLVDHLRLAVPEYAE
ncbi:acyl carrier protein [Streptomyces hypolithicus]